MSEGTNASHASDALRAYEIVDDGVRRVELQGEPEDVHAVLEGRTLGIYTAFRTYPPRPTPEAHDPGAGRRFFALDAHLERADQSMQLSGWEERLDHARIRRALQEAVEEAGAALGPERDLLVRLDVLDPAEGRGDGLAGRLRLTLAPFHPIDPELRARGVRVEVAEGLARRRPRIKRAEFAARRRPYPLHEPGRYEHLLLDAEGRVLEASSSNVFARLENRLWTAAEGMLEGITRRSLLDAAQELGFAVQLEALPLAELQRADEVFLSNSTQGLVPVVCVLEEPIGSGAPGPWTMALMGALERRIDALAEPAWPPAGVDAPA